jgi:hypothetical protein
MKQIILLISLLIGGILLAFLWYYLECGSSFNNSVKALYVEHKTAGHKSVLEIYNAYRDDSDIEQFSAAPTEAYYRIFRQLKKKGRASSCQADFKRVSKWSLDLYATTLKCLFYKEQYNVLFLHTALLSPDTSVIFYPGTVGAYPTGVISHDLDEISESYKDSLKQLFFPELLEINDLYRFDADSMYWPGLMLYIENYKDSVNFRCEICSKWTTFINFYTTETSDSSFSKLCAVSCKKE